MNVFIGFETIHREDAKETKHNLKIEQERVCELQKDLDDLRSSLIIVCLG